MHPCRPLPCADLDQESSACLQARDVLAVAWPFASLGCSGAGACGREASMPSDLHAQRCLKEVVVALCLCLGLGPVLAPHIQTMPPDQHRI